MDTLTAFKVLIERRALARLMSAAFLSLSLVVVFVALHGAQAVEADRGGRATVFAAGGSV